MNALHLAGVFARLTTRLQRLRNRLGSHLAALAIVTVPIVPGETLFKAGVDATFDGVAVPEPSTLMLLLSAAAVGFARSRRKAAPRS